MTITEFLLARLAEDYDEAVRLAGSSLLAEQLRSTRALDECEAKRLLTLAMTEFTNDRYAIAQPAEWTLRVLAAVYSDHVDYRDEWKP